jgi:MOSC domain-containing protein YiiM
VSVTLSAILIGSAVPFGRPGAVSAIAKRPLAGRVALTPEGVAGDEQGDRRVHGGPDKAVHHYPADHYAAWRGDLAPAVLDHAAENPHLGPASCLPSPGAASGRLAAERDAHFAHHVLDAPGAFGENLSTLGLTEADVCVGDVLRIGTATLQVSQARQPCWKLNHRFGRPDMARRVQSTGRTGWYYRVLEAGAAEAGDAVTLLERPCPDWPLARLLRVFYVDMLDRAALAGIAALEPLAASWRQLAQRRLETGQVEDWSRRLGE